MSLEYSRRSRYPDQFPAFRESQLREFRTIKTKRYGTTMLIPSIFPFLPTYCCIAILLAESSKSDVLYEVTVRALFRVFLCQFLQRFISIFFETKINMKVTKINMKVYEKSWLFRNLGQIYVANIMNLEKKTGWMLPRREYELRYPCTNGKVRWKYLEQSSDSFFRENVRFWALHE